MFTLKFSHTRRRDDRGSSDWLIYSPSYDVFHGYHVHPEGHSFEARPPAMEPVLGWCLEQFGEMTTGVWYSERNQVRIWRDDDIFAFKMRWC